NRGRKPVHALSEDLRHTIVELYQSKRYKGSNDHHFAELLAEYEGIRVSPSTVRRVLLRLRKVGSVDEGNEVLPELIEKHNRLFAVEPAEKESAFVPYTHPRALTHILCYRGVYRKVGSGQTIPYQGHTYKIVSDRILPLKTEVEVRQTLDGSVCIEHSGEILFVKRVEKPVRKPASKPEKEKAGVTKPRKPAPNHPWRKAWVTPKSNSMIPQNQGHGQSSSG